MFHFKTTNVMKKFFLSAMLMGTVCMLQAQKMEGSVEPLKGQSTINFVFDYMALRMTAIRKPIFLPKE